jgi:hypothetical protein
VTASPITPNGLHKSDIPVHTNPIKGMGIPSLHPEWHSKGNMISSSYVAVRETSREANKLLAISMHPKGDLSLPVTITLLAANQCSIRNVVINNAHFF